MHDVGLLQVPTHATHSMVEPKKYTLDERDQEPSFEDGCWGDEDDLDVSGDLLDPPNRSNEAEVLGGETPVVELWPRTAIPRPPMDEPVERPKRARRPLIIADVDYNSEDDIIESRKRWVNPRPHRPYLST
jgi:hypothetical protein